MTEPAAGVLAPYFFANALDPAGGRNVVNLILVDFRGFDTLGEITVVGCVAITVYALLRRFRPAPESIAVPRPQRAEAADGARGARATTRCRQAHAHSRRARAPAAADGGARLDLLPAARPQRARRRVRRRARDGNGRHRPVHGQRHDLGRGAPPRFIRRSGSRSACSARRWRGLRRVARVAPVPRGRSRRTCTCRCSARAPLDACSSSTSAYTCSSSAPRC